MDRIDGAKKYEGDENFYLQMNIRRPDLSTTASVIWITYNTEGNELPSKALWATLHHPRGKDHSYPQEILSGIL